MKYSQRDDDLVVLEMTRDDFQQLLLIMAAAIGGTIDPVKFRRWLSFVNDLNNGNPHFTTYEIPKIEEEA